MRTRGREPIDSGDSERLAAMARACEARTSAAAVTLALDATERLSAALRPYCDVRSLEGDPLRIRARCASEVTAHGDGPVAPRTERCDDAGRCAGAALRESFRGIGASTWPLVELLVVSAAEGTAALPTDFAGCREAIRALDPTADAEGAWSGTDAQGEARSEQLRLLARCRAAWFATAFRSALQTEPSLELAILTTGGQPPGGPPMTTDTTAESTSLDIIVQLVPRPDPAHNPCAAQGSDLAEVLQCLERCTRQSALVRTGDAASSASLPSLFDSLYRSEALLSRAEVDLMEVTASDERHLNLSRTCTLLGHDVPVCKSLAAQNLGARGPHATQKP